jgi:hypothetical protein
MIRQGTLYHKRAMSVPVFLHALYGAGYGQKRCGWVCGSFLLHQNGALVVVEGQSGALIEMRMEQAKTPNVSTGCRFRSFVEPLQLIDQSLHNFRYNSRPYFFWLSAQSRLP